MTNDTIHDLSRQQFLPINGETIASIDRAQKLENICKRKEPRSLPPGFFFKNNQLFFQPEADKNDITSEPIFICSKIEITACTRDDLNNNHGVLLKFLDIDNHLKLWAMPMELLAGDGKEYRSVLLSMGLRIAPGSKARNLLTTYIQSSLPSERVRCVSRIGWHGNCFVFPNETIGSMEKERLIFQTPSLHHPTYTSQGTLEEWKQSVSLFCKGNELLTFSISTAFAAPLLYFLGIENGGFHLRGGSSTGKTTSLRVAASVWGGKEYVQRWNTTINGLEAMAAEHNDSLLCLDELSQVNPSSAGETAYMLANGMGKARCYQSATSKKKTSWRLFFLSTGEISLADHMNELGKKTRAGQEVRLLDIPVDVFKYGAFDNLHGLPNGAAFSQSLTHACNLYFGTAGREFIKCFLEQKDHFIHLLKKHMEEFVSSTVSTEADGQVYRAAQRFALVAAVGEIATLLKITGWEENQSFLAARACFERWLTNRGGNGSYEEKAMLIQVRRFFQQHGDSRFAPSDATVDHKTNNRAGFRKNDLHGEVEFFVFPEIFKTEIAIGYHPSLLAKICIKEGLLIPGTNGEPTRSEKIKCLGKKHRFYRFSEKVLGSEEGA